MRLIKKRIAICLILALGLMGAGCQKDETPKNAESNSNTSEQVITDFAEQGEASNTESSFSYQDLVLAADRITSCFAPSGQSMPLANEFAQADDKGKYEIAIELADDMAVAQLFKVTTPGMLAMSGDAVKSFPHPLLLNNYAAMLVGVGALEDALFFFLQALEQEPDNPVLLTNIANIYLDMEDFGAAEQYAKKALASMSEFGPAYQVLTVIHLKNKNSELAAETMVKSAQHCFNDLTMQHFDSFLDEVQKLQPPEDEYPLKEEFIDLLYKIASENVDTKEVNSSADTPGAQLRLKPFPGISSGEQLIASADYLAGEVEKFQQKFIEVSTEIIKAGDPIAEHLNSQQESRSGVYPVKKNLRQIYALRVLFSFYTFKLDESSRYISQRAEKIKDSRNNELQKNYEIYSEKIKQADIDWEEFEDQLLRDLLNMFSTNKLPDMAQYSKKALEGLKLKVEEKRAEQAICKRYTNELAIIYREGYGLLRVNLEEFWLRCGGLMKYLTEENIFNYFDLLRQRLVYSYIVRPIGSLQTDGDYLKAEDERLKFYEQMLARASQAVTEQVEEHRKAEERKKAEEAQANKGGDTVPDIEKEAFTIYPENGDLGDIGLETGLFGFNASSQFNGENFKLSVESPTDSMGGEHNVFDNTQTAYVMHGVKAEANTEWYMKNKSTLEALENAGKVGRAAKALGSIGLGFSSSVKTGEYITTDANKRIIDRGMIYVRESGGEAVNFGRSEKIEVRKSYMTGVALKSKTVKYKFMFASHEN